jgi:TPR repeat protein
MGRVLAGTVPVVMVAGCAWVTPEAPPPPPFVAAGTACAVDPGAPACTETRALNDRAYAGDTAAQAALAGRYLAADEGGRNLGQALPWYRKAAEAKNAEALYTLGYLTETGLGVSADPAQALTYYSAAAEAGSAAAQTNLGTLFETGQAGERDVVKAAALYRRAAAQGFAPAQVNLARLLRDGAIPQEGPGAAEILLRAAAAQGNATAARMLAETVADRDPAEARRLYRTAAEAGDRDAVVALAEMRMEGRGGPRDLVAAKAVLEPLATAAYAPAQFALGRLYRDAPDRPAQVASTDPAVGFGAAADSRWEKRADGAWVLRPAPQPVQAAGPAGAEAIYRDPARAAQLIEAAGRQGLTTAALATGALYYDGVGVPRDMETAASWYRAAAEAGSPVAQANLGVLYYNGRGVPLDRKKAAIWFARAVEAGDATARLNLGIQYLNGDGVPADHARGALLIEAAARQGHPLAQSNLAVLYERGVGVERDPVKARYWRAVAEGTAPSRVDLRAPAAVDRRRAAGDTSLTD